MSTPRKILYIHQYFRTPEDGGCIRSYVLAKGLAQKGVEVELITTHNANRYRIKFIEGVKVHYLPVFYSNHLSFFQRIVSFLRFINQSVQIINRIGHFDLCYTMTTPLSTGFIALYVKYVKKCPYIFEIGDLWPAAPIQMKIIRNPLLKVALRWWEKFFYKKAISLVALSPGIRDDIAERLPKKRIDIIPNISSIEAHEPTYTRNKVFRIGYFGTIGKANHLDYLLDVCELCQKQELQIEFCIMGDGAELDHLKNRADELELKNLSFYDYADKKTTNQALDACDATYVSFWNKPILNTGSPNKFFDGLAAGKLIIINFEGWIKKVIEKEKCGFSYNPEKPNEFIKQLIPFVEDVSLLKEYQINARQLAVREYSDIIAVEKLYRVLNTSVS